MRFGDERDQVMNAEPLMLEHHTSKRTGWLRAAVLGANDGLISTASLIVGVAAAQSDQRSILVAGLAGLVAGAMSMAAGEYVSVSSQADSENADLKREMHEISVQPEHEIEELAQTFVSRGAELQTARDMARQLSEKDALGAHAREELGITELTAAAPLQAAITSAITFSIGAAAPLLVALIWPLETVIYAVGVATLIFLGILGAVGAKIGGAPLVRPAFRVMFWGAVAMAITAAIGSFFGTSIG
jgi:vacuolar iron transporter family protein